MESASKIAESRSRSSRRVLERLAQGAAHGLQGTTEADLVAAPRRIRGSSRSPSEVRGAVGEPLYSRGDRACDQERDQDRHRPRPRARSGARRATRRSPPRPAGGGLRTPSKAPARILPSRRDRHRGERHAARELLDDAAADQRRLESRAPRPGHVRAARTPRSAPGSSTRPQNRRSSQKPSSRDARQAFAAACASRSGADSSSARVSVRPSASCVSSSSATSSVLSETST